MPSTPAEQTAGRLPARRRAHPLGLFLKGFVKHPIMVGSVIPSSPALIAKMLAPVDWSAAKLFVEYGPGVGTFTTAVLDRLPADARLVAIDPNPDFVEFLRRELRDPRMTVVRGSAADVRRILDELGLGQADYILSGLPFSTLPDGVGEHIAAETAAALKPDGTFLVYQVTAAVAAFITPHFKRIERGFEWLNVPPMKLFWARG